MAFLGLESLYSSYQLDTPDGEAAREAIVQANWLFDVLEFDPVSGDALPQSLCSFLRRVSIPKSFDTIHDRLWRIVDFSAESFRRIVRNLNEQPKTDHARMHISKVREMDAGSFVKLANRTGRTIREKLGNDPFVTSVRHFQSVDILENQLLKAFALRMVELLEARAKAYPEGEADILVDMRNWLATEEVRSISRWKNLPPNNALISHRDYRRIWKAWRWLQSLDEDIASDVADLARRRNVIDFWERLAEAYAEGALVIADMPLTFDYDLFLIRSPVSDLIQAKGRHGYAIELGDSSGIPHVVRPKPRGESNVVDAVVCLDFSSNRPEWAVDRSAKKMTDLFVWQQWVLDGLGAVQVGLFDSDAVWLHPDSVSVSMRDLLMPGRVSVEDSERAAATFLSRLKQVFVAKEMVWLVPDCVSEFELSVLRRNINNRYPAAEPLPRSIATAVECVDYHSLRDGMEITVLDVLENRVFATKLIARLWEDGSLRKRVPASYGYYWERQPTVMLEDGESDVRERMEPAAVLTDSGTWYDTGTTDLRNQFARLKRHYLDGDERFSHTKVVFADHSPVVGGIALRNLQQKAGDIPLWRDHLPDLDLGASSGTRMLRVHLVSNETIVPSAGRTFSIPVDGTFTLPAGQKEYSFSLHQGSGSSRLRYQARLSDRATFPLKSDIVCRLQMKYTYGADNPYELRFVPVVQASFLTKSFLVEWVPLSAEYFADNAPSPTFPNPIAWSALGSCRLKSGDVVSCFKDGASHLFQYKAFFEGRPSSRKHLVLSCPFEWREDRNQSLYTVLRIRGQSIFVHEREFDTFDPDAIEISYDHEYGRDGRPCARNVTLGNSLPATFRWARPLLRMPLSVAYSVLRNDEDQSDPYGFVALVAEAMSAAAEFYRMDGISEETKIELLSAMAYFNARIPEEGIDMLGRIFALDRYSGFSSFNKYRRVIALSIGDADQPWQKALLDNVMAQFERDDRWGSVAYEILSIALWRSPNLIHKLSLDEVGVILSGLVLAIKSDRSRIDVFNAQRVVAQEDAYRKAAVVNTLCKHLELLLAMLRTRESGDRRIRMVVMPGSKYAIRFESVIADYVFPLVEQGLRLDSRIDLSVTKPDTMRATPDLLYALKLYLSGDDGANSIIVNGVSDEE